jgi:hypothetical protein
MNTSVACAIGPSVNTFKKKHMWTHWVLNWFFLPNPVVLAICLSFQQQNSLKNQYLPQLSSENSEINSIKSDSPKAFQQHQEHLKIPVQFSVSIYIVSLKKWFNNQ